MLLLPVLDVLPFYEKGNVIVEVEQDRNYEEDKVRALLNCVCAHALSSCQSEEEEWMGVREHKRGDKVANALAGLEGEDAGRTFSRPFFASRDLDEPEGALSARTRSDIDF